MRADDSESDCAAFDTAMLLAGDPDAIETFAQDTGLPIDLIVAMLRINATVNGISLTMAKAPTTIQ